MEKHRHHSRGSVLLETAIGLPFFLALMFAIIQAGLLCSQYVVTHGALQDAARNIVVSCNPQDFSDPAVVDATKTALQQKIESASAVLGPGFTIQTADLQVSNDDPTQADTSSWYKLQLSVDGSIPCPLCGFITGGAWGAISVHSDMRGIFEQQPGNPAPQTTCSP